MRRYLDALGAAAASCLSDYHPEVLAAIREQIGRIAYAHTSFFSTDVAGELAERLVGLAPEGLDYVNLVFGGSVAVDEMTYTFTPPLRDRLQWHDGPPVKTEDCVASIKRWNENDGTAHTIMAPVASIEATSDRVPVFNLAKPFGQVLEKLSKPSPVPRLVMRKRLAETAAGKQVPGLMGSRPFRFVAEPYRPDNQAVYVRTDELDRWRPIIALRSRDVDPIKQVTIELRPMLKANDETKTGVINALGSTVSGCFNHRLPPSGNPKVRQARCLMRFQLPTVGEIRVNEQDIVNLHGKQALAPGRRREQIVFQPPNRSQYLVAALICDEVMVMPRGSVVETGPSAEVLGKPSHEYTGGLIGALPGRYSDFAAGRRIAGANA